MKRPGSAPPQWAHAALSGRIVVPSAGKAADGYAPRERPPAGWWNYHLNLLGQWAGYLAGPSLTSWTSHAFPAPATAYEPALRVAVDNTTADLVEARYRFVVATHDATGPCVLVSRRGHEWARRRNFPSGATDPLGVAFGRDVFFVWTDDAIYSALADMPGLPESGSGASQLRDEGVEWGAATLPASPGNIRGVAYGGNSAGGTTVALTSTKLLYSNTFGVTWTLATTIAQEGRDLVGTGERYVAIGSTAGDGYIVRSFGGSDWTWSQTLSGVGSDTTWRLAVGPVAGDLSVTFVAYKTGTTNPRVHVSTDSGATWVAVSTDAALQHVTSLRYHDGVWVATSTLAPYAFSSNDLERWIAVPVPVPDAAADAALYDAVAHGGSWMMLSLAQAHLGAPAVDPGPEGYTPGTTATPLSDAGWLRGRKIATTAPTSGQVYAWGSGTSQWEPTSASALSVTTTRGDLIVRGVSADQRLALGTVGHYLRADSPDPAWSPLLASDLSGAPWTTPIAPDDGQTTDATTTTIATIATTTDKGHALDLVVSATQSDRSAQVTFKILASITNVAGTCTVRNQLITADDGGASGWAAVLDVSGTNIRVRVTGAGATTIDWIVAGTMLVHGS